MEEGERGLLTKKFLNAHCIFFIVGHRWVVGGGVPATVETDRAKTPSCLVKYMITKINILMPGKLFHMELVVSYDIEYIYFKNQVYPV